MRVALYWAPSVSDPLARAGNAWLGRDPETGAALRQPDIAGIAALTETPRVYGFHATLRPPMRLSTGWAEFCQAAEDVARARKAFDLPVLEVADVGGFLALRLGAPCPALHELADGCVAGTDRHRLRADEAELARRRKAGLSDAEESILLRWGYPYVMSCWSFHMTLSRRLTGDEMARLLPLARAYFASALAMPRRVTEICVFTQAASFDGKLRHFLIGERLRLGVGT